MVTSTHTLVSAEHRLSHGERSDLTARLAWRAYRATDPSERQEAQREIIRLNIRIARAVAARYRNRGIALEDLEQVACEGLVKAVHRFDPSLHHDLLSYAVPTIRGEVLRYFRDLSWVVRPPRRLQELEHRIGVAAGELGGERVPSSQEIYEHLGIGRDEHAEAVQAVRGCRPLSLDQPLPDGGGRTLGDLVPDPVDHLASAEDRAQLAPLLQQLSERDRRVLHLRFVEYRTQREIGEEFGVTQMQVSRWLTRIFAQLREGLTTSHGSTVSAAR
jgi:RNA polymerase sigma-B factor